MSSFYPRGITVSSTQIYCKLFSGVDIFSGISSLLILFFSSDFTSCSLTCRDGSEPLNLCRVPILVLPFLSSSDFQSLKRVPNLIGRPGPSNTSNMAATMQPLMAVISEVAAVPGPTRKPGNLWTVEAREDMFSRREAGEGWETICQDYPNRSRHAMQQQYSMMKKQRALENGTWTLSRRGRKRRTIMQGMDGDYSDDDISDHSPDRSSTMKLPPFSHIVCLPLMILEQC